MSQPHTDRSRPRPACRRRLVAVVTAAATVAVGCYSEVPVAWREAPAKRDVDVTLVASEAPSLAAQLGPRAQALTGRVTARSDSALTLTVSGVTRTNGVEENWPGSEVVLPARAVERVTVRKLSAARSGLVAAAIAGGGALIGAIVSSASTSPGGRIGGPGGRQ